MGTGRRACTLPLRWSGGDGPPLRHPSGHGRASGAPDPVLHLCYAAAKPVRRRISGTCPGAPPRPGGRRVACGEVLRDAARPGRRLGPGYLRRPMVGSGCDAGTVHSRTVTVVSHAGSRSSSTSGCSIALSSASATTSSASCSPAVRRRATLSRRGRSRQTSHHRRRSPAGASPVVVTPAIANPGLSFRGRPGRSRSELIQWGQRLPSGNHLKREVSRFRRGRPGAAAVRPARAGAAHPPSPRRPAASRRSTGPSPVPAGARPGRNG